MVKKYGVWILVGVVFLMVLWYNGNLASIGLPSSSGSASPSIGG